MWVLGIAVLQAELLSLATAAVSVCGSVFDITVPGSVAPDGARGSVWCEVCRVPICHRLSHLLHQLTLLSTSSHGDARLLLPLISLHLNPFVNVSQQWKERQKSPSRVAMATDTKA